MPPNARPRSLGRRRSGSPCAFAAAIVMAIATLFAAPRPTVAAPDTTELDTVVVIGSRAPEPLQQVVGSVSALERDELERAGVSDLADLARLVPGLAAPADAARFGSLGFNLRGLDGNRVSIEIDGVPLPDAFSVGQFALAGRDLADLQAIQRVEVLRGPASTLYGSKALAGVVAYSTRRPEDFLWRGGAQNRGFLLGYGGRDDSFHASTHLALERGAWSALLLLARRQGEETDNHPPPDGMQANPAETRRDGFLARIERAGAGRLGLTFEGGRGERQTDVRSLIGAPGRYRTTTALDADDRWRRNRLSLNGSWEQPWPWLDALDLMLYGQRAASAQITDQYRSPDAAMPWPTLRARRFDLTQNSLGLELVAQSRGNWLGLEHWQVYGVDLARHDYDTLRSGREINLDSGAQSSEILGEKFPLRDFPQSRVHEAGIFWQDEIALGAGWTVVPGLRGERYRMTPRADPIWLSDNPHQALARITSTRWTPKLGLRYAASAHSTLYLQVVRGYRAPPFSDVNIGLYVATLNYEVRPNPELRAETSWGLEAGWRWEGERWHASLAAYDNRFRDLIESRANLGVDPDTHALVFQSVNRDRARIQGVELELEWHPEIRLAGLGGWFVEAQASYARGEDTARRQPLNTIQPARATLGLGLRPGASYGGVLRLTGVRRVRRADQSAAPLYLPAGYSTWDANLWWEPDEHIRVNLQLGNLGDRRYFDWVNLREVAPDAHDLDLFAQPGRWLGLQIALDW